MPKVRPTTRSRLIDAQSSEFPGSRLASSQRSSAISDNASAPRKSTFTRAFSMAATAEGCDPPPKTSGSLIGTAPEARATQGWESSVHQLESDGSAVLREAFQTLNAAEPVSCFKTATASGVKSVCLAIPISQVLTEPTMGLSGANVGTPTTPTVPSTRSCGIRAEGRRANNAWPCANALATSGSPIASTLGGATEPINARHCFSGSRIAAPASSPIFPST
mmetsp:Transcript_6367/g.14688  ORF Transcript_6367/g.14688 Transcript_6367/m.14688 type:complete len:221 (+) Transcript_6367:2617-3279(+)